MKSFIILIGALLFATVWASEDDHGDDHGHGHAHEEEEGAKEEGFTVSAEALKNFDLQTLNLKGKGPWMVPQAAVLYSGEEVNLYRLRDNRYQRVDFKKITQTPGQVQIQSSDLKDGDQVVVKGIGFLRIVEIVSAGGMPHGHSH